MEAALATQIKGPGLFLAQFAGDDAPFNSLTDFVAKPFNLSAAEPALVRIANCIYRLLQ